MKNYWFQFLGVEESVRLVKREGGLVFGYTCDLTNREDVYKVASKVINEVGQVSYFIYRLTTGTLELRAQNNNWAGTVIISNFISKNIP